MELPGGLYAKFKIPGPLPRLKTNLVEKILLHSASILKSYFIYNKNKHESMFLKNRTIVYSKN